VSTGGCIKSRNNPERITVGVVRGRMVPEIKFEKLKTPLIEGYMLIICLEPPAWEIIFETARTLSIRKGSFSG